MKQPHNLTYLQGTPSSKTCNPPFHTGPLCLLLCDPIPASRPMCFLRCVFSSASLRSLSTTCLEGGKVAVLHLRRDPLASLQCLAELARRVAARLSGALRREHRDASGARWGQLSGACEVPGGWRTRQTVFRAPASCAWLTLVQFGVCWVFDGACFGASFFCTLFVTFNRMLTTQVEVTTNSNESRGLRWSKI